MTASVLSKGNNYFRNVLMSVQHTWQYPDITLPSVLTTRYYIPQEWQTMLHQVCGTKNPFDLRCESVTCIVNGLIKDQQLHL